MSIVLLGLFFALPYLLPVSNDVVNFNNLPYPNSKIDTIDNVMLHYRVFTPTDSVKGNILLIHGFSASTFCWRKNYDTLVANGFRLVSVDVPAFGFSDKDLTINNSTTERSKLFIKLINRIDSTNKWTFIGHSMGGGIACTMAAMYPQKTQSLVMVDGVGGNIKKGKPNYFSSLLLCNRFSYRWADVALKNYFLNPKQFSKLLASAYSANPDSMSIAGYMRPFYIKNSGASVFAMAGNSYDTEDVDLNKIDCHSLTFWGTNDTWLPIAQGENFNKKYTKNQLIKISGAGHCGMETHAEVFNKNLISFLKQHGYFN